MFVVWCCLALVLASAALQRHKILLDTDICDDMDDAVALALLLGSERAQDLLAVTTVGYGAGLRASAVAQLLVQAGNQSESVPVFAGSHAPSSRRVGGLFLPTVPYCDLMLPADKAAWPAYNHTDFLVGVAELLDNEPAASVDLVLIGPVTNYARLFDLRPDLVGKLRSVSVQAGYPYANVTMCGSLMPNWFGQYNLNADVPASIKLLSALAIPARRNLLRLQFIGADVTTKCWLNGAAYSAIAGRGLDWPVLRTISDGLFFFHTEYLRFRCPATAPYVFLHDPLTVTAALMFGRPVPFLTLSATEFTVGVDGDGVFRTWPRRGGGSLYMTNNFSLPLLYSTSVQPKGAARFVLSNVLQLAARRGMYKNR